MLSDEKETMFTLHTYLFVQVHLFEWGKREERNEHFFFFFSNQPVNNSLVNTEQNSGQTVVVIEIAIYKHIHGN